MAGGCWLGLHYRRPRPEELAVLRALAATGGSMPYGQLRRRTGARNLPYLVRAMEAADLLWRDGLRLNDGVMVYLTRRGLQLLERCLQRAARAGVEGG